VLRPAVGEDDAGRAVRLLLLLREMFLQVEAKPERHRLFHALAELFAPVLEAWVGGAEKTLARLLETTLAMAPSLTAADGDGDGGDEAALDSLQGGCLKAMEYLERVGGELLPRVVALRLLGAMGGTYIAYAKHRAAAAVKEAAAGRAVERAGHRAESSEEASPAGVGSVLRMRGLRTAALKGARAAVDGARAAVDVALAEPADGASLDPEADPAGWAAALALLNDTVAAHSSLGELLPKMREMVSNCREAWLASNRPSAESGGVEAEAQAADTALTRELGEAFEAIREAVGCAVTPVSDVVLEAVEPDWAAVLNESEEQNSGGQAGTRALHEALLSAREGMCVVVPIVVSSRCRWLTRLNAFGRLRDLSDSAAGYALVRVWEAMLERLEYSFYNHGHMPTHVQGPHAPSRGRHKPAPRCANASA